MPGSCESEQSSSSLISSLRKFRFQNKTKQPQAVNTSAQNSSKNNSGLVPAQSVNNITSQKSSSSSYNPLGYRKYENTNTAEILRNIWEKIRASYKNNSTISIVDLTLTVEETKLLKDTVLQQPAISVKWSTSISEHAAKDSNGKLLKIKRMYIQELLKCISDELKSKFSINVSGQLTSQKPPVRTYSRTKPIEKTMNQSSLNNTVGDQSQGAMDDYEEFCEKEQCLRKMLQTFPGADIMEAQDILVRCQWDLNKAIVEARNQPLRSARKRGFPGNPVPATPITTATPTPNITQQKSMANSQLTDKSMPEEITLDSSDDDEESSSMSQQSRSANNVSNPSLPPAKRARRLISTDSEDEMATPAKSPVNVLPAKSHATVLPVQQKSTPSVQTPGQQKPPPSVQTPGQQKPSPSVQTPGQQKPPSVQTPGQQKPPPLVQTPGQPKPLTSVQTPGLQKPSTSVQMSNSVLSNSASDKTLNVPQSLSIKPVTVSTQSATTNEKVSASPMPNLPKGLVMIQVSDLDYPPKKPEETSVNGNASNIPSNTHKSAQLVRIKTSNKVVVSSRSSSPPIISSATITTASSSSKTINIPMGKGVSLTPVNQTVNVIKNTSKALSITPVNSVSSKDSSLKTKSLVSSSSE